MPSQFVFSVRIRVHFRGRCRVRLWTEPAFMNWLNPLSYFYGTLPGSPRVYMPNISSQNITCDALDSGHPQWAQAKRRNMTVHHMYNTMQHKKGTLTPGVLEELAKSNHPFIQSNTVVCGAALLGQRVWISLTKTQMREALHFIHFVNPYRISLWKYLD